MTGRRSSDIWQQQLRDDDATRLADAQERIADALTRQQPQPSPLKSAAGRKTKFDRDAVQAVCYRHFDEIGIPDNVSEFCRDNVIPWITERYDQDMIPDLETLRPYVPIWIEAWLRSQLPPKK